MYLGLVLLLVAGAHVEYQHTSIVAWVPLDRGVDYDVQRNASHVGMTRNPTGNARVVLDLWLPPPCRGHEVDARIVRPQVLEVRVPCDRRW